MEKIKQLKIYIEEVIEEVIEEHTGTGTYGYVMEYITNKGEIKTTYTYQAYKNTTQERLHLYAIIGAIERIKERCSIEIHLNNNQVYSIYKSGLAEYWKNRGWKNASGRSPQNVDLWVEAYMLISMHVVTMVETETTSYTDILKANIKNHKEDPAEDKGVKEC